MLRFILQRLKPLLVRLWHFVIFRWASLRQSALWATTYISRYWRPVYNHPLTPEQREERREDFVNSINKSAVGALASRYNDQKECFVSDDIRYGSYNVCLFVAFPADNTHWVVRIPISPLVSDVWNKLQSEVATMRFIQRNTTIPVPAIHAYGRCEHLINNTSTTQAFLIMDQVPGQPLQLHKLLSSPIDQQQKFYTEFGDILAQMHQLHFFNTGSLYPDPDDGTLAVIGPSLCLAENDLKVNTGNARRTPPAFSSTAAAVRYQHGILADSFDVPTADVSEDTVKREIFALHSLAYLLPKYGSKSRSDQPFMLSHGDLRCENIIVDDDLHVQGILDWEWATILPRELCTPPLWICGHDPNMVDLPGMKISEDFQGAIATDSQCHEYLKYWKDDQFHLSIAQILRHPHHLVPIYYQHIYPKIYNQPFSEIATIFFAAEDKQRDLRNRLDASIRYTHYLKENGLFIADEIVLELRDLLEKSAKLQRAVASEEIC